MAWRHEANKRLSEAVMVLYSDAYTCHLQQCVLGSIVIFIPFHVCLVFMSLVDTSIPILYATTHALICSDIIDNFVSDSGPIPASCCSFLRCHVANKHLMAQSP